MMRLILPATWLITNLSIGSTNDLNIPPKLNGSSNFLMMNGRQLPGWIHRSSGENVNGWSHRAQRYPLSMYYPRICLSTTSSHPSTTDFSPIFKHESLTTPLLCYPMLKRLSEATPMSSFLTGDSMTSMVLKSLANTIYHWRVRGTLSRTRRTACLMKMVCLSMATMMPCRRVGLVEVVLK